MDPDVAAEFERLEGRISWAAKIAVSIALAVAVPVTGGAIVVYAQVNHAAAKNGEQDAAIEKGQQTREKVVEIEQRVRGIEGSVGEVKAEQREQRQILEEIRARVGGTNAAR